MAAEYRGKKIDTLVISTKLREIKVALRLKKSTSMFLAELGGVWFEDQTVRGLEAKLKSAADSTDSLEYNWVIRYSVDVLMGALLGSGYGHYSTSDNMESYHASMERGDKPIGVKFAFDVIEVSEPIDGDSKKRLWRPVEPDEDGKLCASKKPHERAEYYNEDETLPFTPQRYERLCHLRNGLETLYLKLLEAVSGDFLSLLDHGRLNLLGPGK